MSETSWPYPSCRLIGVYGRAKDNPHYRGLHTRPEEENQMDKITTRARLETYFCFLFSSGTVDKECDCGSRGLNERQFAEILKLLGAKPGCNKMFEFTNGEFNRKEWPCTNGIDAAKAEAYWREFIDEVVSLVGE